MWFKSKKLWPLLLIAILVLLGYLYFRPIPSATPVSVGVNPPKTQAISLAWPGYGQAALGAQGYGVLDSTNNSTPVPIASVTKVITALAILRQKPLTVGSQGPTITFDSTDVDYYQTYAAQDGSVAKVEAGETITEYQALQAMMLPSANNMADSLVRWAFGSTDSYLPYANQMLKGLGAASTTVADASGFGDSTTSTAGDMIKIGLAAMQNPVFAQIVDQPSAEVPVAGQVTNLNWLLGSDGVNGIKTGFTNEAGGCFLVAATHQIQGQTVNLVAVVLDAPDLNGAISSARTLIQSADSGFENITVVKKGQVFGRYQTKWGASASAVSAKDVSLLAWKGKDIKIVSGLDSVQAPLKAGTQVSRISVESSGQTAAASLVLDKDLSAPSPLRRIFR